MRRSSGVVGRWRRSRCSPTSSGTSPSTTANFGATTTCSISPWRSSIRSRWRWESQRAAHGMKPSTTQPLRPPAKYPPRGAASGWRSPSAWWYRWSRPMSKPCPTSVHTEEGPQWRAQRFRLLYLHSGGEDGQEYLRASEQAINIFVEALDLDIEAAQIANEAQLSALIARGAVESAVRNRPASAIPVDPVSGAGPPHRRGYPHRPRHPRLGGRRAGVVEFCTRPRAGPARSRSRAARRGR